MNRYRNQHPQLKETKDRIAMGYPEPLNIGVLHNAIEGNANYAPCRLDEFNERASIIGH